jgi:hypothetical protein
MCHCEIPCTVRQPAESNRVKIVKLSDCFASLAMTQVCNILNSQYNPHFFLAYLHFICYNFGQ